MASSPLLITRDAELRDVVLAAAAAVDVRPDVAGDTESVRKHWQRAPLVLVGTDMASFVVGQGLSARSGLHVVGSDPEALLAWSVPLEAPALSLPRQSGFLSALLASPEPAERTGAVTIRVMGGSGGVGATTLAAGVAQTASRQGLRTALVELDPHGGGVDVLFGAEDAPGWRWDDLASAAGHVGDITSHLPDATGVTLVSTSRKPDAGGLPRPEAVRAVLASVQRSFDFVIIDDGQANDALTVPGAHLLIVVAADVRSVLAARGRINAFGLQDAELVVRRGPGRTIEPEIIAETLAMPVCAVVDHDARLPRSELDAIAPGLLGRGRFYRSCSQIIDWALA